MLLAQAAIEGQMPCMATPAGERPTYSTVPGLHAYRRDNGSKCARRSQCIMALL